MESEFNKTDFVLILLILIESFGPGFIAIYRNHRRKYLITIVSLLIGWTQIGAIFMFLIALKGSKLWLSIEKKTKLTDKLNMVKKSSLDHIKDPKISRQELLKNIIYIKSKNEFFDLTTNEVYKKESINYTYAFLFEKGTATTFLKMNAKKIVVEDWIHDSDPNKRIIKKDGKLYLNANKGANPFGGWSVVAAIISFFFTPAMFVGIILGIAGLVRKEKKFLCIIGILLSLLGPLIGMGIMVGMLGILSNY